MSDFVQALLCAMLIFAFVFGFVAAVYYLVDLSGQAWCDRFAQDTETDAFYANIEGEGKCYVRTEGGQIVPAEIYIYK